MDKKKREREGKPIAVINLFRIPLGTDSPGTHPNFMYTYTQHPLTHPSPTPLHSFIAFVKSDRRMQSISFSGTFNMCPPQQVFTSPFYTPLTPTFSPQGNYREVSIDGKFMSLSPSHMMYEERLVQN